RALRLVAEPEAMRAQILSPELRLPAFGEPWLGVVLDPLDHAPAIAAVQEGIANLARGVVQASFPLTLDGRQPVEPTLAVEHHGQPMFALLRLELVLPGEAVALGRETAQEPVQLAHPELNLNIEKRIVPFGARPSHQRHE